MSSGPRDRSAETRALAERLARDLEPVRRIPPVRTVLAVALALAGLAAGWAVSAAGGPRPDLGQVLARHPGFAAIGLGLAAVALGGVLAGVGASVPGRDRLEAAGRRLLALGAAVAFVLAPGWVLLHAAGLPRVGAAELTCVEGALWVALLPGAAVLAFVFRAAPRRPLWAALAGVAGAAAIGAIAMHVRCPNDAPVHWVLGHGWVPLLAALVAVPPLVLMARAWSARRARRA